MARVLLDRASMRTKAMACATGLLAVVGSTLPGGRAEACGGFFCNNVPVDQTGEHLLFGVEDDGTIVAHIQVQYEGAAEDFAWVLPLASQPEVSVGSDQIFRTLRSVTDPRYVVEWRTEGQCDEPDRGDWDYGWADAGAGGDADADADSDADAPVEVLSQEAVGPYDSSVVRSDDPEALYEWLLANGYVVPEMALPQIQAYVNEGDVFLALKLQKDRAVGDLRPIVVRFAEQGPCIPLRLTSIAATPNMPIFAWVLASNRAVSTNFLDVEVNEAAIDWFSGGANYGAVANLAVDEATGRAFITEYAGDSSILGGAFYAPGRYDLDPLREISDPVAFVDRLYASGLQASPELLGLLRRFIPMPAELVEQGIDERSFYNCLWCYSEYLEGLELDPSGFVDALLTTIVQPLIDAQALADRHPALTRLFTKISAEEMTEDPIFRFNSDLGDVSNRHVAEATRVCREGLLVEEAPVRLVLPDGSVLVYEPEDPGYPRWNSGGEDYGYRVDPGDDGGSVPDGMPGAERARQLGESGEGELLVDNEDAIAGEIDRHYVSTPDGGRLSGPGPAGDGDHSARGGGLCTIAGSGGDRMLALVLLFGLGLGAVAVGRRL